jgi:hypothetical protein
MFVVILGDWLEGVQSITGPFISKEEAEDYGCRILNSLNLNGCRWIVKELELPSVMSSRNTEKIS